MICYGSELFRPFIMGQGLMDPEEWQCWHRGLPRFSFGPYSGRTTIKSHNRELTMEARGDKPSSKQSDVEETELIGTLPKEVGVLLVVAGIGGILLPGPIGSPFLLLGGVTLYPRLFGRLEASFQRHFPGIHKLGTRQIKRFLADLDRRYPQPG
jgi:hypothetical protein